MLPDDFILQMEWLILKTDRKSFTVANHVIVKY